MTAVERVDREAILRAVGLDARDVNAQALLLVCERYGLDPLLKHMVLIAKRPYITRDGYLAIAHASQQLDGIEVVEEGEDSQQWWARVAVYRKDMSHPFVYRGRYPKSGQQRTFGPEMAIKVAEVMALRRAFNVSGVGAADEQWDTTTEAHHGELPPAEPTPAQRLAADVKALAPAEKDALRAWCKRHGHPNVVARMSDAVQAQVRDLIDTGQLTAVDPESGEVIVEADIVDEERPFTEDDES